ncbi:MAG: carboxypeptidase-like regulatory domain-containing protein [Bryobacterales bacterium]
MQERHGPGKYNLSIALALLLALPAFAPLYGAPAQETSKLKILVLEGQDAINNIRQRTARDPIVEVQDENNKPVAGAVVTFLLPDRGASGTFANGAKSLSVTTDAQGRAVATGLQPNGVEGQYQIRVSASHQGQLASASISQANALGAAVAAGASTAKIVTILAIVGGAVAGGVVYAAQQGSNGPSGNGGPPVSRIANVTAGTPTVGAPR